MDDTREFSCSSYSGVGLGWVCADCGVDGWHVLAEFTGKQSKTGSHVEAGSMYKFYRCGISAQLHRRGGKSVKSAQHH